MPIATHDLVESIPPPETVRRMLAESVRRTDLLRGLLRVDVPQVWWTRS